MQPGNSTTALRHRNTNDEDDDFEDEQPLLEPFTQLSLDKLSTSKLSFAMADTKKFSNLKLTSRLPRPCISRQLPSQREKVVWFPR